MGEVFYWSGRQAPRKVKSLTGVQLSSLTAGAFEIVAVDKSNVIHYLGDEDEEKDKRTKLIATLEKLSEEGRITHLSRMRLKSLKFAKAERALLESAKQLKEPKRVVCGRGHIVSLCHGGALYGWGENRFGQLGLGHHDDIDKPTKIRGSVYRKQIIDIQCGAEHTVVVTGNGDMYAFGKGDKGQHGHGESRPQLNPRLVGKFVKQGPVVSVACGRNFSVCCTATGAVWSWGEGQCGQLGTGKRTIAHKPQLVMEASLEQQSPFKGVAAGWAHAGCFSAAGELYVWGFNARGQLGLGDLRSRTKPTCLPGTGKEDFWVTNVACGSFYSAAIVKGGGLYTWGSTDAPLGGYQLATDEDSTAPEAPTERDSKTSNNAGRIGYTAATQYGLLKGPMVKQVRPHTCASSPRRVDALMGLCLSGLACGDQAMAVYATPSLERLSAICGPYRGGTKMTLHGSAFWASPHVQVRFAVEGQAPVLVPGTYDHAHLTVACRTPEVPAEVLQNLKARAQALEERKQQLQRTLSRKRRGAQGKDLEAAMAELEVAMAMDVRVQATVDIIFSEGSRTDQRLPFVYYPQVATTRVQPTYAPARGGSEVTVFGDGFYDFGSAMVRFKTPGAEAVYSPARYVEPPASNDPKQPEAAKGQLVAVLPLLTGDSFPTEYVVDVALNGADYSEAQGRKQVVMLFYNDVLDRCIPASAQVGGATKLQLKGKGFPRSLDQLFDVEVKFTCGDKEWVVEGVVEGATKVSCAMPILRLEDLPMIKVTRPQTAPPPTSTNAKPDETSNAPSTGDQAAPSSADGASVATTPAEAAGADDGSGGTDGADALAATAGTTAPEHADDEGGTAADAAHAVEAGGEEAHAAEHDNADHAALAARATSSNGIDSAADGTEHGGTEAESHPSADEVGGDDGAAAAAAHDTAGATSAALVPTTTTHHGTGGGVAVLTGYAISYVSLTFNATNYCEPVPLYLYGGELQSIEPRCGPLVGEGKLTIHSAGEWFFPTDEIQVRFKSKLFKKAVKGEYEPQTDTITCTIPVFKKKGRLEKNNQVEVEVAMNGITFVRGVGGRAIHYVYYLPPSVDKVEFVPKEATVAKGKKPVMEEAPTCIADAVGEQVFIKLTNLYASGMLRVKLTRKWKKFTEELTIEPESVDQNDESMIILMPKFPSVKPKVHTESLPIPSKVFIEISQSGVEYTNDRKSLDFSS